MSRYRYTGRIKSTIECNNPIECKQFTIIKPITQVPYVRDTQCNPNIYDRAIIRAIPDEYKSDFDVAFIIETFSNLILVPVNLNIFLGYTTNFKDGDIVAIEAEDISAITTCSYPIPNAIPVKLFKISRTWNQIINTSTGIVSYERDSNGKYYYMLTEKRNISLESNNPFYDQINGGYQYDKNIYIHFEIFNIMNVDDPLQVLNDLVGKTIKVKYVDYGNETRERIGLPIVIIDHTIL